MHNLWVPAMVLALENLSFSKVSSMLHSLVHGGSYMIVALKLYKLWCHIKYKCDIKGYVTAIYDGAWWVACVTGSDPEMQEVTLSFLHPRGPSRSFVYPHKADILTVDISDIMTFVEPTTYPERTYTLTDNEMDSTTQALENHT